MVLLLILLLILPQPGVAAEAEDVEYKLKAEMLERFTRFIEWPDTNNSSTFIIGIVGANPFGAQLNRVFENVKIGGKRVEIRQYSGIQESQNCRIIFISRTEEKNLAGILSVTAKKPILTVSDSNGFASKGVLINFYPEGDYVRFEINQRAVDTSGLKFSSRLMKLARIVEHKP